jgi:hypothetical protein
VTNAASSSHGGGGGGRARPRAPSHQDRTSSSNLAAGGAAARAMPVAVVAAVSGSFASRSAVQCTQSATRVLLGAVGAIGPCRVLAWSTGADPRCRCLCSVEAGVDGDAMMSRATIFLGGGKNASGCCAHRRRRRACSARRDRKPSAARCTSASGRYPRHARSRHRVKASRPMPSVGVVGVVAAPVRAAVPADAGAFREEGDE